MGPGCGCSFICESIGRDDFRSGAVGEGRDWSAEADPTMFWTRKGGLVDEVVGDEGVGEEAAFAGEVDVGAGVGEVALGEVFAECVSDELIEVEAGAVEEVGAVDACVSAEAEEEEFPGAVLGFEGFLFHEG